MYVYCYNVIIIFCYKVSDLRKKNSKVDMLLGCARFKLRYAKIFLIIN